MVVCWVFFFVFLWLLEATHPTTAGHTPSHSPFELAFINKDVWAMQKQSPVMRLPAWQFLQTLPQQMVLVHMARFSDMARHGK